jgi:hypothetical protein
VNFWNFYEIFFSVFRLFLLVFLCCKSCF